MSTSSSSSSSSTATIMRPSSSSEPPSSDSTPPTTQPPVFSSLSPSPSAPAATHRRKRRRIHRPATNSLFDLLHEHAGTSLFVRPICWTDIHAQVLGARFEELPPCDSPLPTSIAGSPPSKGHMKPSQAITTLSEALTEILLPSAIHPVLSSNAVRTVLMTLWPDAFSKSQFLPEMNLFFGGRVYRDAVRAQVMWNFPSESSKLSMSSFKSVSTRPAESFNITPVSSPASHCPANLPMMCYIGRNQLASIRKNLFRVAAGPNRSSNEPVYRLQQLRAKALIPSNADHDAHFVGVFLAMAQRHFYGLPVGQLRKASQWLPGKGKLSPPKFEDIKLRILTNDNDTAEFIVYTGYVTAKFLERFDSPLKAPSSECQDEEVPGIKTEFTRVPIWPILGLRERLGRALGHDVVGDFDPEDIETWEDGVERDNGGKRKREALAEVFNGSFDEESDKEQSVTGKKRCLSEGSPIEVVV